MRNESLILIPKIEKYIEYMLEVILKIPRTEKYNIGNEYKKSMYETMSYGIYVSRGNKREEYLDKIDSELILQRIYLRIMLRNKWIDEKKFKVSIELIHEIGKIVGGLIKYYANNKK